MFYGERCWRSISSGVSLYKRNSTSFKFIRRSETYKSSAPAAKCCFTTSMSSFFIASPIEIFGALGGETGGFNIQNPTRIAEAIIIEGIMYGFFTINIDRLIF